MPNRRSRPQSMENQLCSPPAPAPLATKSRTGVRRFVRPVPSPGGICDSVHSWRHRDINACLRGTRLLPRASGRIRAGREPHATKANADDTESQMRPSHHFGYFLAIQPNCYIHVRDSGGQTARRPNGHQEKEAGT